MDPSYYVKLPHQIYDALSNSKFGIAQWHTGSDPDRFDPMFPLIHHLEIQIGDVGYFAGGEFLRFFNVLHDESHELNTKGVPPGFQPVLQDSVLSDDFIEVTPDVIQSGEVFRTSGVKFSVDAAQNLDPPPGTIQEYLFTTTKKNTAALLVLGPARKEILAQKYMQTMRALWEEKKDEWLYHLSASAIFGEFNYSRVLLITGVVKTPKCVSAIFRDRGRHILSITDRLDLVTATVISEKGESSCTSGPCYRTDRDTVKMQCIFIHGLRGNKQLGSWKMSAFAEPKDFDGSSGEPCRDQRVLAPRPGCCFSELTDTRFLTLKPLLAEQKLSSLLNYDYDDVCADGSHDSYESSYTDTRVFPSVRRHLRVSASFDLRNAQAIMA